MKYCQENLRSRDQMQAIRYHIEEIRDTLYECAELDRPLRNANEFYRAMMMLNDASIEVGNLRKFASPLFLGDIERDLTKAVS